MNLQHNLIWNGHAAFKLLCIRGAAIAATQTAYIFQVATFWKAPRMVVVQVAFIQKENALHYRQLNKYNQYLHFRVIRTSLKESCRWCGQCQPVAARYQMQELYATGRRPTDQYMRISCFARHCKPHPHSDPDFGVLLHTDTQDAPAAATGRISRGLATESGLCWKPNANGTAH